MKKLATLIGGLLLCASANAVIYDQTLDQAAGSLLLADGDTITFNPFDADFIFFSDNAAEDFNPQDTVHIESVIEGLVGFDIDYAGEDAFDGGADYSTGLDANFYAIHYDNRELVFGYYEIQEGFSVQSLSHDFSNMRGYTCDAGTCPGGFSEVPLPAAAWMFASGLVGLGVIGRRRSST